MNDNALYPYISTLQLQGHKKQEAFGFARGHLGGFGKVQTCLESTYHKGRRYANEPVVYHVWKATIKHLQENNKKGAYQQKLPLLVFASHEADKTRKFYLGL